MKIRLIQLSILLPLILSGCAKTTLHRPHFSNYGESVDRESFVNALQTARNMKKNNFINDYGCLSEYGNYKVNNITTSESTTKYPDGNSYTTASETTTTTYFSGAQLRFKTEINEKTYSKGVRETSDKKENINSVNSTSRNRYGEIIDGIFYVASIEDKTFQTIFYYTIHMFGDYAVTSDQSKCLSSIFGSNFSFSDCKYYVNKNVFTINYVYTYSNGDSYFESSNYIYQIAISDNYLSFKETKKSVFTSNNTKTESIAYTDFSVKKSKVSINKVDYSNYNLA